MTLQGSNRQSNIASPKLRSAQAPNSWQSLVEDQPLALWNKLMAAINQGPANVLIVQKWQKGDLKMMPVVTGNSHKFVKKIKLFATPLKRMNR